MKYGLVPDQWNAIADADGRARGFVEREFERLITRRTMATLSPNEFKILSFIKSRTLGWQKYAEAIAYSHFINGIRTPDGELMMDKHDWPLCAGTGIRKENTVRACVKRLVKLGYITKFPGPKTGYTANIFMPLSLPQLAAWTVEDGGLLPKCHPVFLEGEYLIHDSGEIILVSGFRDGKVRGWIMQGYEQNSGHWAECEKDELQRFAPDEWSDFTKQTRKPYVRSKSPPLDV